MKPPSIVFVVVCWLLPLLMIGVLVEGKGEVASFFFFGEGRGCGYGKEDVRGEKEE